MSISLTFSRCLVLTAALTASVFCQDAPAGAAAKAPLDHVIGTITAVDSAAQTVTVQEDKTSTLHVVQLANTKTLLKVEPTAKDLKSAVRITAADLEVNDRVDVRGSKLEDAPTSLTAKSVILMSGRALEAHHQQQAAAWTKAIAARVTAIDSASGKITADMKTAGATTSVIVQTSPSTDFSRFTPETGKPGPSQFAQIQVGDQMKVVGDKNDDGSVITAQRVYSGAFRTISITVTALSPDGKSITGKDLSTKKEVTVALNENGSIHKLPPMMAAMIARQMNPGAGPAAGAPAGAAATGPPAGGSPGMAQAGGEGGPGGQGHGGRGDIAQMIQRTPIVTMADLKAGDALVISGVSTSADNSHLLANTIVAGVEPILQAAPTQRGGNRSSGLGSDWGMGEMSAPQ